MAIYQTKPLPPDAVRIALETIAQIVPWPFWPRLWGVPDGAGEMRLYIAEKAAHVTTWQIAQELGARDITEESNQVDTAIALDQIALMRWALSGGHGRASAAGNH